ncbi:MAG: hypothetical protein PVG22_06280 [Chromatiales bacterium]|jgi:hypothetical protein
MPASIRQIGFWSGLAAAAATITYNIVQVLQLAGAVQYPLDEILMLGFPWAITAPLFMLLLALALRRKQQGNVTDNK